MFYLHCVQESFLKVGAVLCKTTDWLRELNKLTTDRGFENQDDESRNTENKRKLSFYSKVMQVEHLICKL